MRHFFLKKRHEKKREHEEEDDAHLYVFIVILDSCALHRVHKFLAASTMTHVYCGLLHVHIISSNRNYTRTFIYMEYI
jgi:hypothetical protein